MFLINESYPLENQAIVVETKDPRKKEERMLVQSVQLISTRYMDADFT